jgi:hypothetical protein
MLPNLTDTPRLVCSKVLTILEFIGVRYSWEEFQIYRLAALLMPRIEMTSAKDAHRQAVEYQDFATHPTVGHGSSRKRG